MRWNAQLHDDDIAERHALPTATARAAQLRCFLDGYRLQAAERDGLVTRMIEYAIRDCADEAIRAQVTPESGRSRAALGPGLARAISSLDDPPPSALRSERTAAGPRRDVFGVN